MMDVEGVEDDGDAILKSIATKTERLVFTWPIRCLIHLQPDQITCFFSLHLQPDQITCVKLCFVDFVDFGCKVELRSCRNADC